MFTLYEIRETDGNDCTVFDCIVEGKDREDCDEQLGEHFDGLAKKHNWESDGGWGYYFPCDCESPDEPFDDPAECDQCEVLAINGVNCHETGCHTYAKYKRELKAFEHFEDRECEHGGLTVDDFNAKEFDTEDEAEEACSWFHSRYEI